MLGLLHHTSAVIAYNSLGHGEPQEGNSRNEQATMHQLTPYIGNGKLTKMLFFLIIAVPEAREHSTPRPPAMNSYTCQRDTVHSLYLTGTLRKIMARPNGISSPGSVSFWFINISHIGFSGSSEEMSQKENINRL